MFSLRHKLRRNLHRRAAKKQQEGHFEICGIVVLNGKDIELEFMENLAKEPYSFSIETSQIKRVMRRHWRRGRKYGGLFHSHPIAEANPGKSDIASAPLNRITMIYDVCGREAKLWKVKQKQGKRVAEHLQTIKTGFYK